MKEADKHLEKLTEKVLKNAPLERPSFHFTTSVMSKIETLNNSVTAYKPLISKTGWFFIIASLLSLTIYLIFSTETASPSLISSMDFSVIFNNKIPNALTNFTLSKTFTYAIALFGLMLCVQIPFLKHHFNQRLER